MPAPTKTPAQKPAATPKAKAVRKPALSFAVFGKAQPTDVITVAGIVRKVKVRTTNYGDASVLYGEFAHRINGGEVQNTARAILPAAITSALSATIEKPLAFSFEYANKTASFIRKPSPFNAATLLP